MDKEVYFFDMDGTLVDSMSDAWNKVILKVLDDRGIKYPNDIIAKTVTLGFMGLAKYFIEHYNVDFTPDSLYKHFMDSLEPYYANEFLAKSGAIEFVKTLKEKGCSVNVLSGGAHKFIDPCIKRLGVFDLFDNVWSVEDFNLSKVDVELYIAVAKKLNAKPENCVLVDDSVNAIKTAKKAGFQTIGVYEKVVDNFWQEMKEIADKFVFNFNELL